MLKLPSKLNRGYTLIEMLVVIMLSASMYFMLSPSLSQFVTRTKLTTQVNEFSAQLHIIKSIAVEQHIFIVMCPTKNRESCNNDWQDEIVGFVDRDNNNDLSKGDVILTSFKIKPPLEVQANRNKLVFAPINTAQTVTASIKFCNPQGINKALVISNMGRVRVETNQDKVSCRFSDA